MDFTGLTRSNLDERLRVEAGVDVLAGRAPVIRLVMFDRHRAVLVADARPRRQDEDWSEPVVELLYLVRTLRPRGFALALPLRGEEVDGPLPRFELRVLTVERRLSGVAVEHRGHPFAVSEDGLLVWEPPHRSPTPLGLHAMVRAATQRVARRRCPALVASFLLSEGHRLEVAPSLAPRLTSPAR